MTPTNSPVVFDKLTYPACAVETLEDTLEWYICQCNLIILVLFAKSLRFWSCGTLFPNTVVRLFLFFSLFCMSVSTSQWVSNCLPAHPCLPRVLIAASVPNRAKRIEPQPWRPELLLQRGVIWHWGIYLTWWLRHVLQESHIFYVHCWASIVVEKLICTYCVIINWHSFGKLRKWCGSLTELELSIIEKLSGEDKMVGLLCLWRWLSFPKSCFRFLLCNETENKMRCVLSCCWQHSFLE